MDAVRANPLRVILPVVVLMGLAVVVGLTRTPTYSAETRLNVGRQDGDLLALPGFAAGVQSLAVGYSRVVGSSPVVARTARALELPVDRVAGRITAAPIPESPLFRIFATGTSEENAVATANAAARAFIAYNNAGIARDREDRGIERALTRATFRLGLANQRLSKARVDAKRRPSPDGKRISQAERVRFARLGTNAALLRLRADTLRAQYRASTQGISGVNFVRVIDPARGATNDRSSTLQKLLFTGLLAGLALGAALAYLAPSPSTYVPRHAARSRD